MHACFCANTLEALVENTYGNLPFFPEWGIKLSNWAVAYAFGEFGCM